MIRLTRTVVQRWLESLLHIHDSPQRTAVAFGLGVFFGFSPFLGLHTVLAVAAAFLFGLNRVAVLLGVYSNLPWIMGIYYPFVTVGTAKLAGFRLPAGFEAHFQALFALSLVQGEFWRQLWELMQPFLWPYVVGSTLGAIVLAAIAYRIALAFVIARRRHLHLRRHG